MDERFSNMTLNGKLANGKRSGGQKNRRKDQLHILLRRVGIAEN